MVEPTLFPGMKAWVCEYDGPDGRYGIVLHASSPEQIIRDHGADLHGLVVLGEHGGTIKHGGDNG